MNDPNLLPKPLTGPSYRRGNLLVVATIGLSAVVVAALLFGRARSEIPAGEKLGTGAYPLGSFALNERSGKEVKDGDLAGRVWVASFIFTRCPSSCPRVSAVMQSVQESLRRTGVTLVSVTVDPDHDNPAVLAAYAKKFSADPDRWLFLTGDKQRVYDLILNRFHLSVAESSAEERKKGAEAIAHSDRLALVDSGNRVVGVFDSNEPAAVLRLVDTAKRLDGLKKPWVRALPAVNATLNGVCAILLLLGWSLIRSGHWKAHAVCMSSAVLVSMVFLACYLTYHYQAGSKAFEGPTAARFFYYTMLLSHTILATFGVVPYVLLTLLRAVRRQFDRHARIAAVTLPIWIYVSITGVLIYLMLYQVTFPTSAPAG